jgi:hypothetical protein
MFVKRAKLDATLARFIQSILKTVMLTLGTVTAWSG